MVMSFIVAALGALLASPASAEQQGWEQTAPWSGSYINANVATSTPDTWCLIYSTTAQDYPDGYQIQAGLYTCAPGYAITHCPTGTWTFGEVLHAGMSSCTL